MPEVGILALQGDFAEHADMLSGVGARPHMVRQASQLNRLDGLIIPGGESTTICRLMNAFGLVKPLREFAQTKPVWGTCAGMIVLAKRASDLDLPSLSQLDIGVQRNAFGRQLNSFETSIDIPAIGYPPFHAVFIRAPVVNEVGPDIDVMARLDDGRIVAVKQQNLMATAFHPELTGDTRLHRYFLALMPASEGPPK